LKTRGRELDQGEALRLDLRSDRWNIGPIVSRGRVALYRPFGTRHTGIGTRCVSRRTLPGAKWARSCRGPGQRDDGLSMGASL